MSPPKQKSLLLSKINFGVGIKIEIGSNDNKLRNVKNTGFQTFSLTFIILLDKINVSHTTLYGIYI